MNPFLLLRIMNRFALVFAVFNLLFALAGYQGGDIPVFLGMSVVTWVTAGLRRGLKPFVLVLPALILALALLAIAVGAYFFTRMRISTSSALAGPVVFSM